MITIRIPAEVRKYKEKIYAGLSARQIISIVAIFLVCPSIYMGGLWLGLHDEIIWYPTLFVGIAIGYIGFWQKNGMPAEKLLVAFLKFYIFPTSRKVRTRNTYRVAANRAKREAAPKKEWQRRKLQRHIKEASLEMSVLMEEAEANGDMTHEGVSEESLITTKRPVFGGSSKDPKKDKKTKRDKSAWIREAEAVLEKQKEDPFYVPTPAEKKLVRRLLNKRHEEKRREMKKKKKEIAAKNSKLKKRRTVQFSIPTTVADTIPLVAAYDEGMFEVAANKYSKAYAFTDVNYKTAAPEEQDEIFCRLRDFYNSFGDDTHIQICVDNRFISKEQYNREVLYELTGDSYDKHRIEYNRIMERMLRVGRKYMRVEKYLVVTIDAAEPMEALLRFHKLDNEIKLALAKIGVFARVLTTTERLAYFHDRFRPGYEGEFRINYDFLAKEGLSEKDYIAPSSFEFGGKSYMQIGDMYYRLMYLSGLPGSLSDEVMRSFYDVDFPITVTHNIRPVNQADGLKLVGDQLTGAKKDKMNAEKKAIAAGYSPDNIREDIKDAFNNTTQLIDDMKNNNQKLFFTSITVMVGGFSLEEMENNCNVVKGKAQSFQAQFLPLKLQQEEAYKMTMPFGYVSKDLYIDRTMTSESTTIFIPFTCTEIYQLGGFYYGLNAISQNFVMVDRNAMKTGSGFVLGSSGSGKSFACKREIIAILLRDSQSSVIIIDPENEYYDFTIAFGGVNIKVSPNSNHYIDPMDMPEDYGLDDQDQPKLIDLEEKKRKAIIKKSTFVLSIVERMIALDGSGDKTMITPQQKTLVDSCVKEVYKEYLDHDFDVAYLPTLLDLQDCLDARKGGSEMARELAEGVEYYTRGSMDLFAHKSNIDMSKRLICFNIRDLGEQLQLIGFVIIFDFIKNTMMRNKTKSIRTYCYCDEIHKMFRSYYSAQFFKDLYKTGRKYGMIVTGITQNCSELLETEEARGMIGNSDFVLMLNQKAEDMETLARLLHISEDSRQFISNVEAGHGLLYAEKTIVPFTDNFPRDSYLYKLMSTKFGEELSDAEAEKKIMEIVSVKNQPGVS